MKIAFFDTHRFERSVFEEINKHFHHDIVFLETRLRPDTASLARGCQAVCCFVNDRVDSDVIAALKKSGVGLLALRSAGFNHVHLRAAKEAGIKVVRVPEYSPYAVAEYAVGLLMTLNRKIHRAFSRVHEMNFSLEGLVGFDLHGKTVGVAGTGKIGSAFCRIMQGFGCRVLAYDLVPNRDLENLGVQYVSKADLLSQSDVISLHIPLNLETRHWVNAAAFEMMKKNVYLINTGRGGLIETKALIQALKQHRIGGACLDVYEEEEGIFFQDLSEAGIDDDLLARLLTFPNVLLTSHQAFLTQEALQNIAKTTLQNLSDFEQKKTLVNEVRFE